MSTLRIAEIFGPTIQGEGALIGMPTVFVRAGGCDYRCRWCDSLHAVDNTYRHDWLPMQSQDVMDRIRDLSGGTPVMVSLSGGNPAISDCSGSFTLDMNAFADGALGGAPHPGLSQIGQQVNGQFWGRDPDSAFGFFFSEGIEYVVGL